MSKDLKKILKENLERLFENFEDISVGFGLNLFDKHNIIVNTNTNKEVGVNYYYKFQSFKKRK